jgi:hypothetical protein
MVRMRLVGEEELDLLDAWFCDIQQINRESATPHEVAAVS